MGGGHTRVSVFRSRRASVCVFPDAVAASPRHARDAELVVGRRPPSVDPTTVSLLGLRSTVLSVGNVVYCVSVFTKLAAPSNSVSGSWTTIAVSTAGGNAEPIVRPDRPQPLLLLHHHESQSHIH